MSSRALDVLIVSSGPGLLLRCRGATLDVAGAGTVANTIREASDDDSIGAVVIQIPRYFSGMTADTPAFERLLTELFTCRKPIVATIEHDICAEGLMIIALSDVAIMLERAQLFGGLALADTSVNAVILHRLRLAMGYPKTFELAALPRAWSAHECLRLGIVSRLAVSGEACNMLSLRLATDVSHLTRSEAWRIDRNYLGRNENPADPNPLLRTH